MAQALYPREGEGEGEGEGQGEGKDRIAGEVEAKVGGGSTAGTVSS